MNNNTYPTWNEIKDEISQSDLIEIMDTALELGLELAIQEYIEATYYTYEEMEVA